MKKWWPSIIVFILLSFFLMVFSTPSHSGPILKPPDLQTKILNLKLEVVRLKKEVFLNKVQLSMFFTNLRIEEKRLVDKIAKLAELKKKQEMDKKAEEGKE